MAMSEKKPISFEQALARLEQLADEIEQGKIGLEESIIRYEEGMGLVKQCREILTAAEQRIVKLQPDTSATSDGAISPPTTSI
jgi:exodeoxyribonuclease VII small subunit